jgi:hypothetical protein
VAGCDRGRDLRNTFAKYARQHGISTALNASATNPFATWSARHQPATIANTSRKPPESTASNPTDP